MHGKPYSHQLLCTGQRIAQKHQGMKGSIQDPTEGVCLAYTGNGEQKGLNTA